jgi:hypothetical protein
MKTQHNTNAQKSALIPISFYVDASNSKFGYDFVKFKPYAFTEKQLFSTTPENSLLTAVHRCSVERN